MACQQGKTDTLPQNPALFHNTKILYISYVSECPLPPWVFPPKSIFLFRRVTLTLQLWQTNSTSVLQHSKDQGISIFFQNINFLLMSDTATPWGKTERLFRPIKTLHSSFWLITQLKMEDYPMPRNNCFYLYFHVRKKGEKWGLKFQNWRPVNPHWPGAWNRL